MKTKLKNITSIQTGVFAKPIQKGEIVYLQAKHFDENGELAETLYPDLDADSKIHKHLLKKGDVLFAAKGTRNFAAWYENEEIPAVASTSFFVIRLHDANVLPGYLTWFLNHPNTQTLLKGQARGSSIASISKAVLSELEIPIPNIQKQELILQLFKLRNKEKNLKQQIENLKEKEIQHLLINAIK
ncbi:MAG: restriction endonuclease subunit S [Salinivirgaceae bacterium]|nr:restriction endonuclease subunit S [Salinivirgaceae bacterium]